MRCYCDVTRAGSLRTLPYVQSAKLQVALADRAALRGVGG